MTISIKNSAKGKTARYAEKELLQFIRKYTNAKLDSDAELVFQLEVDEGYEAHCYGWKRKENVVVLQGGSESALLCCVYEMLSAMGICFTTEGDFLTGAADWDAVKEDRSFSPYCRNRGIRQHINFPMDISSYSLKEAKEYIRTLARMRMNAITFHSYNGQWHPYVKDGERIRAGHFFYGQRHPLPTQGEIAEAIGNRKVFCIPEVEPIVDEPEKREQFAVYWLNEVMSTVKEVGMRLTLSMECDETEQLQTEKEMIQEALRLYPQIDVIELITPEGGGPEEQLTGKEAVALSEQLFGEEVTNSALAELCADGRMPYDGTPTYALGGTLRSIKQIWQMWEDREELLKDFPEKEMQVSLYVTCKETVRVGKAIMKRIFPADLKFGFLPAHGAAAVADTIRHMGFTETELQKTMFYSWIEFDGNMYLQQNSCGGIQNLLEFCGEVGKQPSIHGICFNHWRTAENSLTISYAAAACHTYISPLDFYQRYAVERGIAKPELFGAMMSDLEKLDIYNRDHLFNIGFCALGCWLNPKGMGWMHHRWDQKFLNHSISVYRKSVESIGACLAGTEKTEGLRFLRLLENRCNCSIEHLKAIFELKKITDFTDDEHPEALTEAEREKVRACCSQALVYARQYEQLHIQNLPDRGAEGTLVSYDATIPVYIDHALQYFAVGEPECHHRPVTLDSPPPPDATFF